MTSPSPEDRWAEIHELKVALLRLANATANQLPDRHKFFADLAPSDAHQSAPMP